MKRSLLLAAVAVLAAGCGGSSMMSAPGGGATVGGAKDLGLARSKVLAGEVPRPEDFPPEGIYAEHDLPVDGPACRRAFCIGAASAVAPGLDEQSNVAWVQLGLSSNIDPKTLQRPALELALIIDVSCSMAGGGIQVAREAASLAIDNLGEGDVLTVVEFDQSARLIVPPTRVTDREGLKRKVQALEPKGSTCIECGLKEGYRQLELHPSLGLTSRAVLLTDAMPNVGATGEGEFTELLEGAAAKGVGTTVMGVNLDFGQTLVRRVTTARGANAFYLGKVEDAQKLFGDDFKLWVTPVAYDLDLAFTAKEPLVVAAVHGVPGEDAAAARSHVSTVFLSRERGALVVRLQQAAAPAAELGSLALSYRDLEGNLVEDTLAVSAPSEPAPAWASTSTRKALALTRFVLSAREACRAYLGRDTTEAAQRSESAALAIAAEAQATGDAGLASEARFARALADLLALRQ